MKLKSLISQSSVVLLLAFCVPQTSAQTPAETNEAGNYVSKVWVSDQGNGTYKNPILYADYSDPDVVRVGDDFYMVSSSFNAVPGLPILHSKDLVNWTILGHVFRRQSPYEVFSKPQHGNGVWAPAIRYHGGEFFIFYPDPDFGIYMTKSSNPAGPWSEPLLIKEAKGWIDPCPLWDDDGKAYLVSALAASRSGVKSIIVVSRMAPDGTKLLDDGVMVFDGHEKNPTIEGPKFYKRNGYYYIFAPAGGVEEGWQLVLRSKRIYGPYQEKIVLAQGPTPINGPHQGAWVDTQTGEDWFIHFQDKGPYGRIVHLQPMRWVADWPIIGVDPDGDGTGQPVLSYKKPNVGKTSPVTTPRESDEFSGNELSPQWQWQANPGTHWAFPAGGLGFLRLFNVPAPDGFRNFRDTPNLLLQKFPAPQFSATTKITFTARGNDEETGLIVMGQDYAYLSVKQKAEGLFVSQTIAKGADTGAPAKEGAGSALKTNTFFLRVKVSQNAVCNFSYSADGNAFIPIGEPFTAQKGRWIGAKVGLFAVRTGKIRETGYADIDWFRVE